MSIENTIPTPGSYWVGRFQSRVQILLYPPRVLTDSLLKGGEEPELNVRYLHKEKHLSLPRSKFLKQFKPLTEESMKQPTFAEMLEKDFPEPRPSRDNQAADNLRKYGFEVPDKDLPLKLSQYLEEAMTCIQYEGFLDCLPDRLQDWWKETGRKMVSDRTEALRQSALAKLTDEEIDALGIER